MDETLDCEAVVADYETIDGVSIFVTKGWNPNRSKGLSDLIIGRER